MRSLKNVSIKEYKAFLDKQKCSHYRTKGGHEHWAKPGLARPITFQTHIDPIPKHIIENGLRTLVVSKKDFIKFLESL